MENGKIRTESELVSWVNDMKRRERRRNYVIWAQWVRNLAAFHGRPDIIADTETFRLMQQASPKALRDAENVAINLIQPHARMLAAKMQKSRPILSGVPPTSDESDIQAAKVADRLMVSEWHQQEMDARRLEMAMWQATTGNSYWHQYFDPVAGEHIEDGIYTGQLKTDTCNNFKIVHEPKVVNVSKARWAIISEQQPIDSLQEKYGESYRKRKREELEISRDNEEQNLGETAGISSAYLEMLGIGEASGADDKEFTTSDIFYHLPTKKYPGGMYAIIAGGKVLWIGKYPYPFLGRLPILHFREILTPWRCLGDSSASQVLSVQDNYNTIRNIEKKHLIGNSATKILRPVGTTIDKKRLKSRDDEIVDYDPGRKGLAPVVIQGRNVPQSLYQSLSLCREEAQLMGGISDPSQGIPSSNAASGRAILALQEMDETKLGPGIQLNETEYTKWGQNTILMVREFYEEPRKYAMVGGAMEGSVFFFDRADLKGVNDVRCQPNSSMPQNKYAKQETVLGWYGQGLLGPVGSPEAITLARRMAEIGTEDLTDDDLMDEQNSEKENIAISQSGNPMPAGEFDNHLIHLKIHARKWKSPISQENPQLREMIAAHMREHLALTNPQQPPQQPPQEVPLDGNVATQEQPQGEAVIPTEQGIAVNDMNPEEAM